MLVYTANAKLNLCLTVTGKRPDGYHTLDMVMQSVGLADVLTFEKHEKILVACDAQPLAQKAALAFFAATGIRGGVSIGIEKCIPYESGLGGSSADAAATLMALNTLYGDPLSGKDLMKLGLTLGADVPFSLLGGTARAAGVGEQLESIACRTDCWYAILQPMTGISTVKAFALFDSQPAHKGLSADACVRALERGTLSSLGDCVGNDLEEVATLLCPDVARVLGHLRRYTPHAFMTGSGSASVGIFETREQALAAATAARDLRFACVTRPRRVGLVPRLLENRDLPLYFHREEMPDAGLGEGQVRSNSEE